MNLTNISDSKTTIMKMHANGGSSETLSRISNSIQTEYLGQNGKY